MKIKTLDCLNKIYKKWEKPFGKIVQKLLALTLHEIGFNVVDENEVQGEDIVVIAKSGERYAIEVKTTHSLEITMSGENINSLLSRRSDGYMPVISALRIMPFERWLFAKVKQNAIPSGKILVDSLRRYNDRELSIKLTDAFDRIVYEHFEGILKSGSNYLKEKVEAIKISSQSASPKFGEIK